MPLVVVCLFGFIAGFSLLHPGLPPTHDGEYHVIRFYEFDKVLREGDLYPRWAPDLNNGFGVPLFNYVYPLPNYVAYLLHLFGTSFIDAFKLEMFLATILGGVLFYLWSKEYWGELGGIVSSIFYTFSPYHFVDIYIRGSVGEVWALALFPGFLWSFTKFEKNKEKIFLLLSSVFFGLIIYSHNILALMFFIFSVSYIIFLIFKNKSDKSLIKSSLLILFLGLCFSAAFWLPALIEKKYAIGLAIFDATALFPDLYELIIPSWGSGFSGASLQGQLSAQIGIANLFVIALSTLFLFIKGKKNQNNGLVIFFLSLFFIVFFLMLKISLPLWRSVPFMNYFQFPWRFLSLEILFVSFLAGFVVSHLRSKIFTLFIIAIAFFLGLGYAKPAFYHYRNDNYYITRSNFIDGTNSPGDVFNTVFLGGIPKKAKEKIVFLKGKGSIEKTSIRSTSYIFNVSAKINSEVAVNTSYFPGWTINIDNKKREINNSNGLISFLVPAGHHLIKLKFGDTAIRTISNLISLFTISSILILFIKILFVKIRR